MSFTASPSMHIPGDIRCRCWPGSAIACGRQTCAAMATPTLPRKSRLIKHARWWEDVAALIKAANAKETLLMAHDWGGKRWPGHWRCSNPNLSTAWSFSTCPHPACFARELQGATQLMKSWYIFFSSSFPGCCLNSCWAAATPVLRPALSRGSSRNSGSLSG